MKIRYLAVLALALVLAPVLLSAQHAQEEEPAANPARPTVSTPATITPVGYLQFESGYLGAWHAPELSSQSNFNEVIKLSLTRRLEVLAAAIPFAHSRAVNIASNAPGDVALGAQAVLQHGESARPTIALSYFRQVRNGDAPDIDIDSPRNLLILLASADVKGFHYDTNFLLGEVVDNGIRRAQLGQTLSISHPLAGKFGISGELWHVTQPFRGRRAVGNLWALNYNLRKNLVFDAGFNRGLTNTSARWSAFFGCSYLLPHRLLPARHSASTDDSKARNAPAR
jgi:hypothetical protein